MFALQLRTLTLYCDFLLGLFIAIFRDRALVFLCFSFGRVMANFTNRRVQLPSINVLVSNFTFMQVSKYSITWHWHKENESIPHTV